MGKGLPAHSTIATMYKTRRKDMQEDISNMALQYEDSYNKSSSTGDNYPYRNPYRDSGDPRKVLTSFGDAFRKAAESDNTWSTVTTTDYEAFRKKIVVVYGEDALRSAEEDNKNIVNNRKKLEQFESRMKAEHQYL